MRSRTSRRNERVRRVIHSLCWSVLFCAGLDIAFGAQVSGLQVRHNEGQTFVTWREVEAARVEGDVSVLELRELSKTLNHIRYRIYRSDRPITSVEGLAVVAQVGPLTAWNTDYYGRSPKPNYKAFRYVVEDGEPPVPAGTAVYVHNPRESGKAYYAVTAIVNGKEVASVGPENSAQAPVDETVGPGVPVLQRVTRPKAFLYVDNPTLHYYVRWEAPPRSNTHSRPFDYVVAVPPNAAKPAPVGIHLHEWGASLNWGHLWWYNAHKGALLLASNQIPYDWWTGYHERLWKEPLKTKEDWQKGVVRPYTQLRMLGFVDWMTTKWQVDPSRTFAAGVSMGGSGAAMLAIRFPERVAWAVSGVGVHIPSMTPTFKGSYEQVYGKPEYAVNFENGSPVWKYFNDAWYLREHPEKDIGLVVFSNGKNDGNIGWPQAVEFYRALQETRQPHVFLWGQQGHGQRPYFPAGGGERFLPIDVRIDQSLPAFTRGSLDGDPGNGDPGDGAPAGHVNMYLYWETGDIVDTADRWGMTVGLARNAPADESRVDVTPRRLQELGVQPGQKMSWTNRSLESGNVVQEGTVTADQWGLLTLPQAIVSKGKNRLVIQR